MEKPGLLSEVTRDNQACEHGRIQVPRASLGRAALPDAITQEPFEGDDRHLRRLGGLRPGERAHAADLWQYTQDLRYTEI